MMPKDILMQWIETFNRADAEALAALFHPGLHFRGIYNPRKANLLARIVCVCVNVD